MCFQIVGSYEPLSPGTWLFAAITWDDNCFYLLALCEHGNDIQLGTQGVVHPCCGCIWAAFKPNWDRQLYSPSNLRLKNDSFFCNVSINRRGVCASEAQCQRVALIKANVWDNVKLKRECVNMQRNPLKNKYHVMEKKNIFYQFGYNC